MSGRYHASNNINVGQRWQVLDGEALLVDRSDELAVGYSSAKRNGWSVLVLAESCCDHLLKRDVSCIAMLFCVGDCVEAMPCANDFDTGISAVFYDGLDIVDGLRFEDCRRAVENVLRPIAHVNVVSVD